MNSFEYGFTRGFKHGEKHTIEYIIMCLDVCGDDTKLLREFVEKEQQRIKESIRNNDREL